MANIQVILSGTNEIYRYDKNGLTFVRNESVYETKTFVTTTEGIYLIDGFTYTKDKGNKVYTDMIDKVGERTFDSYVGAYKFKNHSIVKCTIEPITADNVDEFIERYDKSIDNYAVYIDDYSQYKSAVAHNERCERMIKALKEIYKG